MTEHEAYELVLQLIEEGWLAVGRLGELLWTGDAAIPERES